MTNLLSRRAVVRAIPFIAAAGPAPVLLTEEVKAATPISPDWMEKAIDAHRRAFAAFDASCPFADSMDARYIPVEGPRRADMLGEQEQVALNALLILVPASMGDVKKRAAYLLSRIERCDVTLSGEQISMLLASVA